MIDFNTIAQGADSGFHTASQMVINSRDKWAEVWQQHTSDTVPPPPVPQVDFTQHQVVAVFAGERNSSGYSVEIVTVETWTDNLTSLVITVKYYQPQPIIAVLDVITHPYHIIRIPRIAVERVVFERV